MPFFLRMHRRKNTVRSFAMYVPQLHRIAHAGPLFKRVDLHYIVFSSKTPIDGPRTAPNI